MQLLDWMAGQHMRVIVFALAPCLLLPYALIAAQRPGRGIKPWWTTSRYISWIGFAASVLALATGALLAKNLGLLNDGWIIKGEWTDLKIHQCLGGATVFFGFLCLRTSYARRREHQGLGVYALITGLLWAVSAGAAGQYGIKLVQAHRAEGLMLKTAKSNAKKTPEPVADPNDPNDPAWIMKVLDYASLVPMHAEPVRSPAHKNRWVRVWVSQNALEAYTSGNPLPEETLIVMNSVEDRWGRPSYDIGPLYTLEVMPGGKPRVGMYWSYVPESKRDEVNGAMSVTWAEPNSNLASCLECHSEGMAAPRSRSRTTVPRRPRTETNGEGQSQPQQPQQPQPQPQQQPQQQ